jgi:hypothetical protein
MAKLVRAGLDGATELLAAGELAIEQEPRASRVIAPSLELQEPDGVAEDHLCERETLGASSHAVV